MVVTGFIGKTRNFEASNPMFSYNTLQRHPFTRDEVTDFEKLLTDFLEKYRESCIPSGCGMYPNVLKAHDAQNLMCEKHPGIASHVFGDTAGFSGFNLNLVFWVNGLHPADTYKMEFLPEEGVFYIYTGINVVSERTDFVSALKQLNKLNQVSPDDPIIDYPDCNDILSVFGIY